jgi:cation-transporting P-type ATPase I
MLTRARSFLASNRDASRLVQQAKKFSVRLPVVGKVSVPPPDQLAFYGVLGALAAVSLIDWPVAVAIGVGQAVVARHFSDRPTPEPEHATPPAREVGAAAPVRTAVSARKATPCKAAARKTAPRKAAARKAAPRKTAPSKAAARKTAPRKAAPRKAAPSKAAARKAARRKAAARKATPRKVAKWPSRLARDAALAKAAGPRR